MEWIGLITAATFRLPGKALEHDLRSGSLQTALELLAERYNLPPPELPPVELPQLQAAYVQLFAANPAGLPAPPYAGYALDGKLMGEAQEALEGFYAEHGLAPREGWGDLPDHLSAVGEAIALLAGPKPDAARKLALGYLKPWLDRYAEVVVREDPTGFYATVCTLLKNAMEEEHAARS